MQDPYKKRQFRGIVLPIEKIRKEANPFDIKPTDTFQRELVALAANNTYTNKYRLIEAGFTLAKRIHNYHRIDDMDFEKYSYTYWCRFKYSIALKPRYYVYLRCRDKEGKYIHIKPPLAFMRDIVHLERFVDKEEIYPMHLPIYCQWNARWRMRRELTLRLMHVHYIGRKVSKKLKVTTAERKARTRHMNGAVKTFPTLEPGEAYMRYAMILFQRMPHYKQMRLSDNMAVCEVYRKAGIPYETPATDKDKLLP